MGHDNIMERTSERDKYLRENSETIKKGKEIAKKLFYDINSVNKYPEDAALENANLTKNDFDKLVEEGFITRPVIKKGTTLYTDDGYMDLYNFYGEYNWLEDDL